MDHCSKKDLGVQLHAAAYFSERFWWLLRKLPHQVEEVEICCTEGLPTRLLHVSPVAQVTEARQNLPLIVFGGLGSGYSLH